jgi:hypothetical protein
VVTSVIFYPAAWLGRIGLGGHGVEAKLYRSAVPSGWKFNIAAVRAVPENALIFTMCREGNLMAVRTMLKEGYASVRDTSPAGWTPLHVRKTDTHLSPAPPVLPNNKDANAPANRCPSFLFLLLVCRRIRSC